MDKSFEERVKHTRLTKTGKKIAEYMLQNKSIVVFQPLSVIADELQISDVSIVRFARTIGYDGFPDLKHALQTELLSIIDEEPESINTVVKYVASKELKGTETVFSALNPYEFYTKILKDTLQQNDMSVFDEAAKRLTNSDKKYIVGWRSRIGSVQTMSVVLELILPNVIALTDDSYRSFLRFSHLTKDDCVVLFSFGRLPDIEIDLIDAVKNTGAYLIVISDQRISKSSLAADLFIYSSANTRHLFYSSISNVMIAEIIASNITDLCWNNSKNLIQQSEDYINRHTVRDK